MEDKIKCPNCGKANKSDREFCYNCRKSFTDAPSPASIDELSASQSTSTEPHRPQGNTSDKRLTGITSTIFSKNKRTKHTDSSSVANMLCSTATTLFVINVVASFIVFLAIGSKYGSYGLGFVTAIITCLSSAVTCLILYAFGIVVEKLNTISYYQSTREDELIEHENRKCEILDAYNSNNSNIN